MDRFTKSSSADSYPLVLDIDDFKGDFLFDALFGNLVNELLPSYQEDATDSGEGNINSTATDLSNGNLRFPSDAGKSTPMFPQVDALLPLFKNSCTQLIDLRKQIDGKLYNLQKEVAIQDSKHRKTLGEHLMEFNSSPADLMELSPLFYDDNRVAEAASIVQKLR